jgi:aspartate racemase
MRTAIGIVGGLGPEGTVHYYRKLSRQLARLPEEDRPGILVDHVWMDSFARLLRGGDEQATCAPLLASLRRLHAAGAGLALLAAVTPHLLLPTLRRQSPIELVDLVEATKEGLLAAGHRTVSLLGTRLTLTRPFFKAGLEAAGLRVVVPDEEGIDFLDTLIFGALATGERTQGMADGVSALVRRMGAEAPLDAVVVACTDLMDLIEPGTVLLDPIDCHLEVAGRVLAERTRATR